MDSLFSMARWPRKSSSRSAATSGTLRGSRITEEFVCKKVSGPLYDFCLKAFGYLAVFTGIACLFLMIFAFMSGGGH